MDFEKAVQCLKNRIFDSFLDRLESNLDAAFIKMHKRYSLKIVLDKIIRQARASNATRIKTVQLAIGEISELDTYTIQKHWNELSKNTVAENAELRFHMIIAEVQCMSCFKKYHPENGVVHCANCANCGSFGAKILAGEEFHVEFIEMDFE